MATIKATAVANADAYPRVLNQPHLSGNYVRQAVATVEVATTDANGSTYRLARLRSSDRVSSIGLACDALGGSAACKIGLYAASANGVNGAVVGSGNQFVASQTLVSAIKTFANVAFTDNDIANTEKRLWEVLGLSADPGVDYDLCVTLTAVAASAGTISVHVAYVSGN
jgi:hypothetical protein